MMRLGRHFPRLLAIIGALAVSPAAMGAEAPPPKAYIIGQFVITDPAGYKTYAAATMPIVEKFGGVYLVRGGRSVAIEGPQAPGRTVVIVFPSVSAAEAFEASPEYQAVAPMRRKAATGRLYIVEGVEP